MKRLAIVSLAAVALLWPAAPAPATGATPVGASLTELLWTQEQPGPGGPQVADTALAWDPAMGAPIAYAGAGAAAPNTSWQLFGNGWRQLSLGPEPTLHPTGLVYDEDLGDLVLVGVDPQSPRDSATWLFDGYRWTKAAGAGPPAVRGAALAYDETTSTVVLFGGLGADGVRADTWRFDGKQWSGPSSGTAPPPAVDAAFGWGQSVAGLVLFSGTQTWTWSHGAWTDVHAAPPFPPGRYQIVSAQQQALLVGRDWSGNWHAAVFDGIAGAWDELQPDWPAPPPVAAFLAFYDRPQQQLAVFGGPGTGSPAQLWAAALHTEPPDSCPILVEGGHVETSATLLSLKSSYGVQLDAEHLANGGADVSMVASTEAGVDLAIGFDHKVEQSASGSSAGGDESSWGVGATLDAALKAAEGWDWHFDTVTEAQNFIGGSAAQWTQHNLVNVVPVIGGWLADNTGQIALPQPEKAYVDHGTVLGLILSGSFSPGGAKGALTGHLKDEELTGGGLLFDQATGAGRGRTVDFSSTIEGGIAGTLGLVAGPAGVPVGGGVTGTERVTGETSFDASGAPTEFSLTTRSEGELSTTAGLGGDWDFGEGAGAGGEVEIEQASGTAVERELTLPLDRDPTRTIPVVQALLDAIQNSDWSSTADDEFQKLVHEEGTDTLLTYHTTSGTTSGGVHANLDLLLTFGAGGEVGNDEERLVNAQAWDADAKTFTPWTSCLAGMEPKQQPLVPPPGTLPGTIVYETGWPNTPAIDVAPAVAPTPPAVLTTPYFSPALSPGGTLIAADTHLPWEPISGAGKLVVMNVDGTNPRVVYQTARGTIEGAQWSPDGRWIAFIVDRPKVDRILLAVDLDGKNEHVFGQVQSGVFAWSPDGSEVAIVTKAGGVNAIPVAGGVERHILDPPSARITALAWAPAHDILFTEDGSGAPGVEEMAADGSGLHTVLPGSGYQAPSWAPDLVHFLALRQQTIDIAAADGGVEQSIGNGGVFSARWGGPASVAVGHTGCGVVGPVSAAATIRRQLAVIYAQAAGITWSFPNVAATWGSGPLHVLDALASGGTGATGEWFFFFAGGCEVGHQVFLDNPHGARVDGSTYAVAFDAYKPNDPDCCPSGGQKTVSFHWDGTELTPALPVAGATP